MRYIESPYNDAFLNMALEEYVFEGLPKDEQWFMLWQNASAVVVGKFQNTAAEIDAAYVRDNDIQVVRRLSGGGAMYQDLGNLNFTFVVDQDAARPLDFSLFTQPVVRALAQIGVRAETGDRNDILIDGKKFSGNSQYNKKGRTMHHGTLLFNSRLDVIGNALRVKKDKIESKGVKSVRSRVTNISDAMTQKITLEEFKQALLRHMFESGNLTPYSLTETDLAAVEKLRDEKYATWDWTWGRSPAYNLTRERRYPFGGVTVGMRVEGGVIREIGLSGDFFGNGDIAGVEAALTGQPLRADALEAALAGVDVQSCISGMDAAGLVELLLY